MHDAVQISIIYSAEMNLQAAALAYVRHVLETLELKPGALALKAGVQPSTLTRALNDPNHKFALSTKTIEKIANFSKINPAPFLDAKDSADIAAAIFHDNRRIDDNPLTGDPTKWPYRGTIVAGKVAAGVWQTMSPLPEFELMPLHLVDTSIKPENAFACMMADNSASLIADEGDFLLCERITPEFLARVKTINIPHGIGAGPVIVERRSKDGFQFEMTARFMRRIQAPGHWQLVSASYEDHLDRKKKLRPHLEPVLLDNYEGNDEYRIIGRISSIVRGGEDRALQFIVYELPYEK